MTKIHRKQVKKIQARREAHDKAKKDGHHRPGSMNPKKQA